MIRLLAAALLACAAFAAAAEAQTAPGYCYSNNGLSFRACDAGAPLLAGEVWFAGQATADQLTAAFTGYTAAVTAQAQALAAARAQALATSIFAEGIAVTSETTPALNGTWAFTVQDQVNIMGLQVAVLSGATFPISYVDTTGAVRSLSAAQATALALNGKSYNNAVLNWIAAGATGEPPSNAVSVP